MSENPQSEYEEVSATSKPSLWQRLFDPKFQKVLSGILTGVVLVIVAWIAYGRYQESQNEECQKEMFWAERYFRQDSFLKALQGSAQRMGFINLVEEYGSTPAGNLCKLYAGLCYLKLGKFSQAVEYLEDYDEPKSFLGAMAYHALAGAYAEVGEIEKAAKAYEKAGRIVPNSQTTPFLFLQAALLYEHINEKDKARRLYEEIIDRYPASQDKAAAEKHLARLSAQ
ncbi:MAG: tetratricopeptide repeat protein [Bacteroidia bacterium]